jgi:hypothetical protein
MSLARRIIPRARCKLLDISLQDNLMVCFEKGMYFLRQAEPTIVSRAVSRLESARGLQKACAVVARLLQDALLPGAMYGHF